MSAFKPTDFDLPIVDAHHHFFLLEGTGYYPWLQGKYDNEFFLGNYRSICQTFNVREYRRAVEGFDLVADVHVEAERSRQEQVAETSDLKRLNTQTSMPTVIVGHVYFDQPDRTEVLAAHAKEPLVRGIRSKPVTSSGPDRSNVGQPGTLQDPNWQEGLAELGRFGFSWDLRVPYWHLAEAAEVVKEHPDIPVVVNHAGLPLDRSEEGLKVWRHGMRQLADLPHVCVKISELGLRGGLWDEKSNRVVIREAIEFFGFERSMFASNLPVCTLTASFSELVRIVLSAIPHATEDEVRALFARTATSFYRIAAE